MRIIRTLVVPVAGLACAVAPAFAQQSPAPAPSQPERAPDTFAIYAIDVSGTTLLSQQEIERIVYRFTGPERSNVDVEQARQAIQKAYADKGYESVLVESPLQKREFFEAGIITIAVTEAPVGKVEVTGAKYASTDVLRRQLPAIREGQPIDFKALQQQFDGLNRFADRQVDFLPKPGETPGTTDVELAVKDTFPLHSSFEYNNDNSPNTTRSRVSGTVRYTDVWRLGHTLTGTFIIAPERRSDSSVVAGSYVAPILGTPWTISASGYRSNSNIAALGGTNVLGNGYQIGVRAGLKLPTNGANESIGISVDYKDFDQDLLLNGASVGRTPIRYIPLTLDYSYFSADADSGFAKSVGTTTVGFNASATAGLRAIKRLLCLDTRNGQSQIVPSGSCRANLPGFVFNDQFTNSAVFSSENFFRLNTSLTFSLATKSDFVATSSFSVQLADVHLVTNEQFSAGGRSTVRGYFESEAVGDEGFVSAFEVAAPSLAPLLGSFVNEFRVYGFTDTAVVRTLSALPGQTSKVYLWSAGGGLRVKLFDRLSGEVIVGVPLIAGPTSPKGDVRTVFVVRGEL